MFIDLQTSYGANYFEQALYKMQVGSPICNITIQNLLSAYYLSHKGIKSMFDSLGILPRSTTLANPSLFNSILIINVDAQD